MAHISSKYPEPPATALSLWEKRLNLHAMQLCSFGGDDYPVFLRRQNALLRMEKKNTKKNG